MKLRPGMKWLSLKMEGNFHPTNFIQVPIRIDNWHQIISIISQLSPLNNQRTRTQFSKFQEIDKKLAFGYILGIFVSDASKNKDSSSSLRLALGLSKKYSWSKEVGEATCHYLHLLGINAWRSKDIDSRNRRWKRYLWLSRRSPFLLWIERSCLGLKPAECTTYYPIQANWLLDTPLEFKIKILQGLNDGDGWSSITGQRLGNACEPNTSLIKRLFKSIGIHSTEKPRKVLIIEPESIIRAVNLPFFLHASGRQMKANELARMMKTYLTKKPAPIKGDRGANIIQLYSEGKSPGYIAKKIYDDQGIFYRKGQVYHYIRRVLNEKH